MSVGGWITDEFYGRELLSRGADKLVVNSAVKAKPELVTRLADRFGRQCVVASIDFSRDQAGIARVCIDRGRDCLDVSPEAWAARAEGLGAGEILLNCIERDGFRKGYDLEALSKVCSAVSIPVIAFGGVFRWRHLIEGVRAGAHAVAAANIFHYTEHSTKHAKRAMADAGIAVRKEGVIQGSSGLGSMGMG
jgi:cyclase